MLSLYETNSIVPKIKFLTLEALLEEVYYN